MIQLCINNIYIEWPAFFGSVRGYASAARNDLVNLSVSVGYIAAWLERCGGPYRAKIIPVHVRDWKGQLPKDVVIQRIKKKIGRWLPDDAIKSHAWDAIGIGLFAKGHFE